MKNQELVYKNVGKVMESLRGKFDAILLKDLTIEIFIKTMLKKKNQDFLVGEDKHLIYDTLDENKKELVDEKINELLGVLTNDVNLGDVYEFIINKLGENAGKSGGEYYTPKCISQLMNEFIKKLYLENNKKEGLNIYDPSVGSGNLIINTALMLLKNKINCCCFGNDINEKSSGIAGLNTRLLTNGLVSYGYTTQDSLLYYNPRLKNDIDIVVANPPYSLKGKPTKELQKQLLSSDERYKECGVLPPNSAGDFAFVLDSLYCLKDDGIAFIIEFPGVCYRSGAEKKIRKYITDKNYLDAVVSLPKDLFYGTNINTNLLILRKNRKEDEPIKFIDGENEFIKNGKKNTLTANNINNIVDAYFKSTVYSKSVSLEEVKKIYNGSVSNYVLPPQQNKEPIDFKALNYGVDVYNFRDAINLLLLLKSNANVYDMNKPEESFLKMVMNVENEKILGFMDGEWLKNEFPKFYEYSEENAKQLYSGINELVKKL